MTAPEGVQDPTYLGDGVYAGHVDKYFLVLWLDDGGPPGRPIYLEPQVREALDAYRKRIWKDELQ